MKIIVSMMALLFTLSAGTVSADTYYTNDYINITNRLTALSVANKTNVVIDGCLFQNVGIAIVLTNCSNVTIKNCVLTNLTSGGIILQGICTNVSIFHNVLYGFQDGYQGGHMIATTLADAGFPYADISVINNLIVGPEKSWGRDTPNGATGDMIAMKSVDGFSVRRNVLTGGGEFGITSIGSTNGVIADNTIHRNDATGIFVGYNSGSIVVKSNHVYDVGMSYGTGDLDVLNQAGIRLYGGAWNIDIRSNLLHRVDAPEYDYGLMMSQCSVNIYGNTYNGSFVKQENVPNIWSNTVTITRDP